MTTCRMGGVPFPSIRVASLYHIFSSPAKCKEGRPVPGIDTGISPAHSFYHVSDPVGIASIDQESLFDHPEAKDRIFKVEQHNVIRVVVQWLNGCKVGANALR